MIKKNRILIIITSVVTLIPMLIGILCWNQLPDTVATHFTSDGTPNGFSSRMFAVLGLPAFIFAAHLLCAFCTAIDPKHRNISPKMYRLTLLICPVSSLACGTAIYGYALNLPVADYLNSSFFVYMLLGVIFFLVGNYLPKCHQNYTVGIKLPWTLADEDNWNLTHRFSGRLFVVFGILCMVNAFLKLQWFFAPLIIGIIILPAAYSLRLYQKEKNSERF